jgi:isoquinoline 1-oxidoreductase beta subunit
LLAAAKSWGVPVEELSAASSVITHRPSGRTTTYGAMAPLAAQTPHPDPERIRIKPPSEWTLMGTEQRNLDVPLKVTGKTIYGIDVRLRHEMGGRQGLPGLWRHGEELRF